MKKSMSSLVKFEATLPSPRHGSDETKKNFRGKTEEKTKATPDCCSNISWFIPLYLYQLDRSQFILIEGSEILNHKYLFQQCVQVCKILFQCKIKCKCIFSDFSSSFRTLLIYSSIRGLRCTKSHKNNRYQGFKIWFMF